MSSVRVDAHEFLTDNAFQLHKAQFVKLDPTFWASLIVWKTYTKECSLARRLLCIDEELKLEKHVPHHMHEM